MLSPIPFSPFCVWLLISFAAKPQEIFFDET